jgi:predicted small secreted protein
MARLTGVGEDMQIRASTWWMFLLLWMGIVGLFLVGCNTIWGIGQDIQKAGEKIQKAAQ